MNSAIRTYGKREFRKVLLLPVVSLIYTVLVYGLLLLFMKDRIAEQYLKQGFSDITSYIMSGDCFFYYLYESVMNVFYVIAVLGFEFFLVQRLFYLENREGVSDFLRILPLREKEKVFIKLVIGEGMIFLFALIYGIGGTVTYKILERDLVFQNQVFGSVTSTNSILLIWKMALLMFVTMSAVFLVLYLAQSVIHHRAAAFAVGAGVLGVPMLFAGAVKVILHGSNQWIYAAVSLLKPYGNAEMVSVFDAEDLCINRFCVEWNCYYDALYLWSVIAVVAGVLIAVSVKYRWNVRESSNRMINSAGVHSFLLSGVSFCVAVCVVLFADLVLELSRYERIFSYLRDILCDWLLLYGIGMCVLWLVRKRMQKNG